MLDSEQRVDGLLAYLDRLLEIQATGILHHDLVYAKVDAVCDAIEGELGVQVSLIDRK